MLLAVYGTLREGDYNHKLLGLNPKFLVQERVHGFQMYNLSNLYPCVVRDDNASILVEVYDVPEKVFDYVTDMELSAGYGITSVNTSVGDCQLFYMTQERMERSKRYGERSPKILSGDWFEWLDKYKPGRVNK